MSRLINVFLILTLVFTKAAAAAPYEWKTGKDGNFYWYEEGKKQGAIGDPQNLRDEETGIERGREIYDPDSDAWYWLDAQFKGARAAGKEVWMPYIYQSDYALGINQDGKWVRYDEDGQMVKGWYRDADGNKYYYDLTTGAMYKGEKEVDGVTYFFDTVNGVCLAKVTRAVRTARKTIAAEAKAIALDDSHGYTMEPGKNRGPVDFDCSGLVHWCIDEAGIEHRWYGGTADEKECLTRYGFVWMEDFSQLKVGDILLKKGHTAIYCGDGYVAEALHNEWYGYEPVGCEVDEDEDCYHDWYMYGEPGDQTGTEIVYHKRSQGNMESNFRGFLRYIGN